MARFACVGLTAAVALAISAMAATTAFASQPEFKPGTPVLFLLHSGPDTLEASTGEVITCTNDLGHGEINGPRTEGKLVITFHGCNAKSGSSTCTVKSPGNTPGLITLDTIKAELGSVKTTEAASGVGLLLEPASGTAFATIQGNCIVEAAVSGSIAGEIASVNKPSIDNKLVLAASKGSQAIKSITVLGSTKKPALLAFGGLVSASEATTDLILLSSSVEVT
jgi:hypothetical protein